MEYYVGEIRMFAGSYAPEEWQLCDGSLLQINSYQLLYALIGTTWGGDGRATFAVPDLRGRLPIGQGLGANLTQRVLGQTGGTEQVILQSSQIPVHNHGFTVANATATASIPSPTLMFANPTGGDLMYLPQGTTPMSAVSPNPDTLMPTGSSGPHGNVMPSFPVNFIISTSGLFPDRP
ncbi:MAG: tail fiber protein [Rhodospirillales bacterium]|nr:tail fiber protein [Rhodospirillales bacterium]